MNAPNHPEVPCSICGAEHDPTEAPELDSTHLCASCARAQRDLRVAALTSRERLEAAAE